MATYGSKYRAIRIGTARFTDFAYKTENKAEIKMIEASNSFKRGEIWRVGDAEIPTFVDAPEEEPKPEYEITDGAYEALSKAGVSPTVLGEYLKLQPGTKITKNHVNAYLRATAR